MKVNHGKVINKGRTARVGVSTFSFPLERNKTLQLVLRSGEGGPGAQRDQDRRMSLKGQKQNFRQRANQIRMVRNYVEVGTESKFKGSWDIYSETAQMISCQEG